MPAFSIGMTMSYSVVGLTFYLRDEEAHEPGGATLVEERRVVNATEEQPTPSVGQDLVISQPGFSIDEDQASWFGNFTTKGLSFPERRKYSLTRRAQSRPSSMMKLL